MCRFFPDTRLQAAKPEFLFVDAVVAHVACTSGVFVFSQKADVQYMHVCLLYCTLFAGYRLSCRLTSSLSLRSPAPSSSSSSFVILIKHELIEFSSLVWESTHEDWVRGETRVSVSRREFGGRSLAGMALSQACTHQLPVGQWSPSAATCIFILLTVTLQHFRERPHRLVRVRWKRFIISQPEGGCGLILSVQLVSGDTEAWGMK